MKVIRTLCNAVFLSVFGMGIHWVLLFFNMTKVELGSFDYALLIGIWAMAQYEILGHLHDDLTASGKPARKVVDGWMEKIRQDAELPKNNK